VAASPGLRSANGAPAAPRPAVPAGSRPAAGGAVGLALRLGPAGGGAPPGPDPGASGSSRPGLTAGTSPGPDLGASTDPRLAAGVLACLPPTVSMPAEPRPSGGAAGPDRAAAEPVASVVTPVGSARRADRPGLPARVRVSSMTFTVGRGSIGVGDGAGGTGSPQLACPVAGGGRSEPSVMVLPGLCAHRRGNLVQPGPGRRTVGQSRCASARCPSTRNATT
jgi:hypothetical protein